MIFVDPNPLPGCSTSQERNYRCLRLCWRPSPDAQQPRKLTTLIWSGGGTWSDARGSTRCKQNSDTGADKGTKQCSFVAIYATTPIWPSFREASKDRFCRPLMQQRRHPTYASVKVSADFPLFGHITYFLGECSKVFLIRRVADNQEEGWGQVHLIAKQSNVSGQRPPSHLQTFPGIVLRKFLKEYQRNPYYIKEI